MQRRTLFLSAQFEVLKRRIDRPVPVDGRVSPLLRPFFTRDLDSVCRIVLKERLDGISRIGYTRTRTRSICWICV